MRIIFNCFLVFLLCISCSDGSKTEFFGLPWGTNYSQAKKIIRRKGFTINEGIPDQNNKDEFNRFGLQSWISISGKHGQYNAFYFLVFHSNKFADARVIIDYPNEQIQKLQSIEMINQLNTKYGTVKENDGYLLRWEKDNVFISMWSTVNENGASISLNYSNENYYNNEILERYKIIEDIWKTYYLKDHDNIWTNITGLNYDSMTGRVCRIIISKEHVIFETYDFLDDLIDKNPINTKGPYPYIITGNKITFFDEYGNFVELQYAFENKSLTILMDNNEMKFSRK